MIYDYMNERFKWDQARADHMSRDRMSIAEIVEDVFTHPAFVQGLKGSEVSREVTDEQTHPEFDSSSPVSYRDPAPLNVKETWWLPRLLRSVADRIE